MDMESLPIDIHCTKILSWLVSRHHCGKKWQEQLEPIRTKINAAIEDMPENEEIRQLIAGSYITYFHCLKIVDILKETECGAKNIFGQYSSQKMRDWQDIIRLYTHDGVYLGEAAQILVRNVSYEVPAIKKQREKCLKTMSDCASKAREYSRHAADSRHQFEAACKQLGIPGHLVKKELLGLAQDLPHYLERFAADTKELQPAVELYGAVTKHLISSDFDSTNVCPKLHHLITKGNTTVFEFRYGRSPERIEAPNLDLLVADDADRTSDNEIDWGDLEEEIDFGITVEEDDNTAAQISSSSDCAQDDSSEVVARGEEAQTLLDHPGMREAVITELAEVSAFLQRFAENFDTDAGLLDQAVWEDAPDVVTNANTALVMKLADRVTSALERLDNSATKHLLLIRSSPRYVDRVADQVAKHQQREERQKQAARLMELRRAEEEQKVADLEPVLTKLCEETRALKSSLEKEISQKYNGRRVNIMGDVNTM